jgi:hypothetical protein
MSTTVLRVLATGVFPVLAASWACASIEPEPTGSQVAVTGSDVTASTGGMPSAPATPTSAPTTKQAVGDPCSPEDGWLPAPYATTVPTSPTLTQLPPTYIEQWQLPPGVGYCGPPGGVYPYGYFTMNCSTDADCPAGARCDDIQCRRPCSSDRDCKAPTTCMGPSGSLRFCYCDSCMATRQ